MDPLDFLESAQLQQFFHSRKTELSCLENPQTFLSQLRDYNLIPEDRYKKVIKMKSKDRRRMAIYEFLDWMERERSEHIPLFWRCVFKEIILSQYPIFRLMRNSLMDGSFQFDERLPPTVEKEEKGIKEDKEARSANIKRRRSKSTRDDEEQLATSSQMTPHQKKSKKIAFASPKKGEEIWTWPFFKNQLPVTCGSIKGILNHDKLAKGEKCIKVKDQWFTPAEFEKFAGKEKSRNWKSSIRCENITLGKLIQEGHLKCGTFKRSKMVRKSLFSKRNTTQESDEDEDEDDDPELQVLSSNEENSTTDSETEESNKQPEIQSDKENATFEVSCGQFLGILHSYRFLSGTRGLSIRTEDKWMSPVEFVMEATSQTDATWRKDIIYNEEPLNALIEAKVLSLHSLLCKCRKCKAELKDKDNQKNDDECYICEDVGDLVVCDHCPKSFHPNCHLPHIEEAMMSDNNPWMCTFCIFKTVQNSRYNDKQKREVVLSRQVSQHIVECQYLLLFLRNTDKEQIFNTNPELNLENYRCFVETPMWLGKITDKLQENQYKTVGQFESDIQLIFSNCGCYNRDNAEFLEIGKRLKETFDKEFKKAFNIHD
ncbi:autoimmune regulator-like isoform X1 [Oryzias latipes]|uniref:SP110 nuclear body protein, tandem duplicate 1 n=1 Tax=Oryzias latipes TaxID=8090 RepID=A0A3B3H529_ORYLA|nr:autoimmune regulator-like isoform X1 [Oryzias latipes]